MIPLLAASIGNSNQCIQFERGLAAVFTSTVHKQVKKGNESLDIILKLGLAERNHILFAVWIGSGIGSNPQYRNWYCGKANSLVQLKRGRLPNQLAESRRFGGTRIETIAIGRNVHGIHFFVQLYTTSRLGLKSSPLASTRHAESVASKTNPTKNELLPPPAAKEAQVVP